MSDLGRIAILGPPVVVPIGPRGRGIAKLRVEAGALVADMTDGTTEPAPLPLSGDTPGGIEANPDSIPINDDVRAYVAGKVAPLAVESSVASRLATKAPAAHTHAIGDVAGLEARLKAGEDAVAGVIAAGATDAELAAAIAALDISAYVKATDASNTYAPKAHTHVTGDLAGLDDRLSSMDAAIRAASGMDMSGYAKASHTHTIADVSGLQAGLDAKLTQAQADARYAPLGQQADLSAYLRTTDAASTYAAKSHTHAIADTTGLQAALDAKLTQAAGDARYALAGQAAAKPVTYAYSQAGTLAVKAGTGALYNDSGAARTITVLRATVGTAPTGAGVSLALKVAGSTVATATIAAGSTTVKVTGSWAWADGQAMTVDITGVGTTVAGADLTVSVLAG